MSKVCLEMRRGLASSRNERRKEVGRHAADFEGARGVAA